MEMKEIVLKNRSYRRFYEDEPIDLDTLKQLVDLARLSASSLNLQSLKYILSCDPRRNALVFPTLGWAMLLKNWAGPQQGERPSAYIIIVGDTEISSSFSCDHGIVAQSILLGATEKGLGGCMLATIRKKELSQALGIAPRYEILLVIALGKPKEKVVIDPISKDGDTKYWRDSEGVHHVPKRALDDIIIA